MLGIDALGKLDEYSEVFDIEYYRKNKEWYLLQLLKYKAFNKHDYIELYPYFKKEINMMVKLKAMPYKLYYMIPASIRNHSFVKKIKSIILRNE